MSGARPRFGTSLPGVQQLPGRVQPWETTIGGPEIVAAARAAEAAGFAWVSCCDHPFVPASRAAEMGSTWFDAGSTLAFVAGVTERIELLSHVLVLPYRHPLVVAKQYGTLDHLSGGRVILGVGSGHLKPEFKTLGADYERRGLVSDEYLQAIAVAWEQEVASFEGETVRFRDAIVAPRVARRPPLWVGGNSRAAARRAARYGDGWIPWELTPEEFGTTRAYIDATRLEAQRAGAFEFVAPLPVAADATKASIVQAVARWQNAGATAFHVGVSATSRDQFHDRLAWFGREIA